ncbi:hypothetical protein [Trinickia diaoshuihuensis]|uniref:hypothetical protein n=1 Tax=Trinickia diaoshuihuensis TaxID=2292265 RepID=UPI0013C305C6|nr:hypothetical protein [Trinickia diaoshuihuensis]
MNRDATRGCFTGVRWGRLTLGVVATGVLSLSVHVVMLQVLHVPYPGAVLRTKLPDVLNGALMIWAAIWVYDVLRTQWDGRSAWLCLATLFALLAGLNETLRAAFMSGYCSTHTPVRWLIGLLASLRPFTAYAVAAGFAAGIAQFRSKTVRIGGTAAAALVSAYFIGPALVAADAAIRAQAARWMPDGGWCTLPYGIDVLVPAYLTFIEPVFLCFACAILVWNRLPGGAPGRTAAFVLLILALKRHVLASLLYAIYAPGPAMTALASVGQFSLEAAALAGLTAVSWRWARPAK